MRFHRFFGAVCLAILTGTFFLGQAHAIRIRLWPRGWAPFGGAGRAETMEVWDGYRSILLLPAQNETQKGGAPLAAAASRAWMDSLAASKKFSIRQVHGRNPAVMRAVEEKSLSPDVLAQFQQQPGLEGAFNVATSLGIDFIGELKITKYEASPDGKRMELALAGVLYDVATRSKSKEIVTSVIMPAPRRQENMATLEMQALKMVTDRVVQSFLGKSLMQPSRPAPRMGKSAMPQEGKAMMKKPESKAMPAPGKMKAGQARGSLFDDDGK